MALVLALGACGADDAPVGAGGAEPVDDDVSGPILPEPGDPDAIDPTAPSPADVVEGAVPLRQLDATAEVVGPRTVRVSFVLGLAPCSVLAGVEVVESDEAVQISAIEGREPGADCSGPQPPIAAHRFVDVETAAPIGDRTVLTG